MHLIMSVNSPTNYVRPDNEVHTEYPKWIKVGDAPKLVNSAAEEEAVIAGKPFVEAAPIVVGVLAHVTVPVESAPVSPQISFQGETDERTMLLAVAASKGIQIDKRWGLNKIRAAVEAAQPPAVSG